MSAEPEPKPHHIRTDSGVDVSETLVTAQSICKAVSSFGSDKGLQDLVRIVGLVPKLENEINQKDEAIKDLNDKIAALNESHNAHQRDQLSGFLAKYDDWKKENSLLQSGMKECTEAREKNDAEMKTIRDEMEDYKKEVEGYKRKHDEMAKKLEEKDKQLADAEAKLRSAKVEAANGIKQLKDKTTQALSLKSSYEEEKKKHLAVQSEVVKLRDRVNQFAKFSAKIESLDLKDITEEIENLWKSAIDLIGEHFGRELPQEILQSDWSKLRDNAVCRSEIPLPQSNADIAKKARVAMILNALATLVDKVIFQPTYLLVEDSGLRDILRRQAAADPNKERYTRGILLSMFPDDQAELSKEDVEFVVEELMDTVNAKMLLTADVLPTFEEALQDLVKQFRDLWKRVQHGKQKLEPSFAHLTCTKLPWHVFDMQIENDKDGKHGEQTLTTTNSTDDVVIFPRVYIIGTETEPVPITHGYVLQKAQILAAEEENRKLKESAPFARGHTTRHRMRPARGMSMDSAAGGRRGERFLG